MPAAFACLTTHSPEQTTAFARKMAALLRQGDTVLLEGDIGSGKTHFARSLIQSLQDHPEDVPSPTFTLVQTYETRAGEIWHADLYRLSGPDEIVETGLFEAMDRAICLIEWPDRLAADRPAAALTLQIEPGEEEDSRQFHAQAGSASDWPDRIGALF